MTRDDVELSVTIVGCMAGAADPRGFLFTAESFFSDWLFANVVASNHSFPAPKNPSS